MDTITRSVTDLPAGERQVIEHLLGCPLAEEQQVFIMAFTPGQAPDESARAAARGRLEKTFAAAAQNAKEHGISAAEADAAVADAMAAVRPRHS